MLPFILVFASIFVFPVLGILASKFRKEKKQLLVTLIEVLMFVLAVNLFLYLFNTHEFLFLFISLVIYVESRIDTAMNFIKDRKD